jgi:hypothetical protein
MKDNVTGMEEVRNADMVLVEKPEVKRLHGRRKRI